ncbi:MAG: hypothetical protein MUC50_03250 [Myxococcota bacterium]|jgi:serine/threonine protein kinase|nr:hypothetical protein [Myxococcota bacterium]
MKLQPGTVVKEVDKTPHYPRRYRVLSVAQTTRCHTSYFCRSESEELKDLTVLLTVCNYNPRLLGKRQYVDNLRARLEHQGQMLTTPENALPEPVDFFRIANTEDVFQFEGGEEYKQTEPVLVTERYHGVPLDRLINDKGKLKERRALEIALGLCKLLANFHKHGVLIYELSPEDLVIDETDCDRPWLLSAANHQYMKSNGKIAVGELVVPLTDFAFTAPEVEAGRDSLDARSDIYSLGALLLYMLTAKKPKEVIQEGQRPVAAIYALPGLAPETIKLLYRCLAPEPAYRFQDCAAMEKAIVEAEALSQVVPPPSVQSVQAKRESQHVVLRWTLPSSLSQESSIVVRRYVERQQAPPDPSTWDALASALACTQTTFTDESPAEGARLHYAVFVQQTSERGPRFSVPSLALEEGPARSTAREFFWGLFSSPGLVLLGIFTLLRRGMHFLLRNLPRLRSLKPGTTATAKDSPRTLGPGTQPK